MNGKLRMKPDEIAKSLGIHAVKLPNGKDIIFDNILTKMNLSSGIYRATPGEITLKLAKDQILSRFDALRDGVHFRCYLESIPQACIELIFRRESDRKDIGPFIKKVTAAVASVIVFCAEKPACDSSKVRAWVKATHKRFFKESCKHGALVYTGVQSSNGMSSYVVQPEFTAYIEQCRMEIESLANLNVAEALNRVEKDFSLLVDSLTEDDILQLWRGAIVNKVHES